MWLESVSLASLPVQQCWDFIVWVSCTHFVPVHYTLIQYGKRFTYFSTHSAFPRISCSNYVVFYPFCLQWLILCDHYQSVSVSFFRCPFFIYSPLLLPPLTSSVLLTNAEYILFWAQFFSRGCNNCFLTSLGFSSYDHKFTTSVSTCLFLFFPIKT